MMPSDCSRLQGDVLGQIPEKRFCEKGGGGALLEENNDVDLSVTLLWGPKDYRINIPASASAAAAQGS